MKKFDDLNVGDKIYYYDTLNNQYIVREGTIMSKDGNNESALYFLEETGNAISDQRLIGVHEKTYAGLGTAYTIIKSQVGFLLLSYFTNFSCYLFIKYINYYSHQRFRRRVNSSFFMKVFPWITRLLKR